MVKFGVKVKGDKYLGMEGVAVSRSSAKAELRAITIVIVEVI
jgi:hypothetical protein